MSFSSVVEVGVGLILIYYLLSTLVQLATNQIARWASLSEKQLAEGIRRMLKSDTTVSAFYNHPLIADISKKQIKLSDGFQVTGADFIPSQTFALALFDILVPGEKSDAAATLQALRDAAQNLPDSHNKAVLVALLSDGTDKLESAQQRIAAWFDSKMAEVSKLYENNVRLIVLLVAAALTLILGVDSIDIATTLWQQPLARGALNTQAAAIVANGQSNQLSSQEVLNQLSQIGEAQVPVFWDFSRVQQLQPLGIFWKIVGLFITWFAVIQGAPFWNDVLQKVKGG